MNKFKKGLSLIAAIAFLITALVPVAGLAAENRATVQAAVLGGGATGPAVEVAPRQAADVSPSLSTDPSLVPGPGSSNRAPYYILMGGSVNLPLKDTTGAAIGTVTSVVGYAAYTVASGQQPASLADFTTTAGLTDATPNVALDLGSATMKDGSPITTPTYIWMLVEGTGGSYYVGVIQVIPVTATANVNGASEAYIAQSAPANVQVEFTYTGSDGSTINATNVPVSIGDGTVAVSGWAVTDAQGNPVAKNAKNVDIALGSARSAAIEVLLPEGTYYYTPTLSGTATAAGAAIGTTEVSPWAVDLKQWEQTKGTIARGASPVIAEGIGTVANASDYLVPAAAGTLGVQMQHTDGSPATTGNTTDGNISYQYTMADNPANAGFAFAGGNTVQDSGSNNTVQVTQNNLTTNTQGFTLPASLTQTPPQVYTVVCTPIIQGSVNVLYPTGVPAGAPVTFNINAAPAMAGTLTVVNETAAADQSQVRTIGQTFNNFQVKANVTPSSAIAPEESLTFNWYESASQINAGTDLTSSAVQLVKTESKPNAAGGVASTYQPVKDKAGRWYYACVVTRTDSIGQTSVPVGVYTNMTAVMLPPIAADGGSSFTLPVGTTITPGSAAVQYVLPSDQTAADIPSGATVQWTHSDKATGTGLTENLNASDVPTAVGADGAKTLTAQLMFNGQPVGDAVTFTITGVDPDTVTLSNAYINAAVNTDLDPAAAANRADLAWTTGNMPKGAVIEAPANISGYTAKLTTAPSTNASLTVQGQADPVTTGAAAWATTLTPAVALRRISSNGIYVVTVTATQSTTGKTWSGKVTINGAEAIQLPSTNNYVQYALQPDDGLFNTLLTAPDTQTYNAVPWVDARHCGVIEVPVNGRAQLRVNLSDIDIYNGSQFIGKATLYGGDPANKRPTDVEFEWRQKSAAYVQDEGNGLSIPTGNGFFGVYNNVLTIGPITPAMDGMVYGLNIRLAGQEDIYKTTMWVELDVDDVDTNVIPNVSIDSYPERVGNTVTQAETGIVTLTANVQETIPESALAYQWSQRAPATTAVPNPAWTAIEGATEKTYELDNISKDLNGYSYRCRVTNNSFSNGPASDSPVITLNVTNQAGAVIVTAPVKAELRTLFAGRTTTLETAAKTDNGEEVTYQWFVKGTAGPIPNENPITTIDQAKAYVAQSPATAIEGATGTSFTTQPLEQGVYEYTCRVQNASNAAQVAASAPVYVVVTQRSRIPAVTPSEDEFVNIGVLNGNALTMTADGYVASGEPLTYQWYILRPEQGSEWTIIPSATSSTLTIPNITTQYTGWTYQCRVSNPAAGTSTPSGKYYVNVWNNANIPTVTSMKLDTPASPQTATNGIYTLTSQATLPQGWDHAYMWCAWYDRNGALISVNGEAASGHSTVTGSVGAVGYSQGAVASDTQTTASTLFTNELKLTVTDLTSAREVNSLAPFTCRWFNWTTPGVQADDVAGAAISGKAVAASAGQLVMPQSTPEELDVDIAISGDPKITKQPEPATAAVGTTASFSVGAALNPSTTSPQPSTVYTWQMTRDGGQTWENCTSADGTGQFTQTFTTIPLTQQMYDYATASNIAGNPNANTAYQYRVIVANRNTGIKVVSVPVNLTITPGTEQPTTAVLKPAEGANVTITSDDALGKILSGEGLTATKDGNPVSAVLAMVVADPENENYKIQIVSGTGDEQKVLADTDVVATGDVIQLVNTANNDAVLDSVTVIVRGDVMGNGRMSLTQLVWLAEAFKGDRELTGAALLAGDLDSNGSINLTDLVREATIYKVECMGSTEPPGTPSEDTDAEPSAEA